MTEQEEEALHFILSWVYMNWHINWQMWNKCNPDVIKEWLKEIKQYLNMN